MIGARRRIKEVWRFERRWLGEYLWNNGSLGSNPSGAQCVNVANAWLDHLGSPPVAGNASDFQWVNRHDLLNIRISRSTRLRAGDIVVFPVSEGSPFGHVDVVLDGSVEPYLGLDQDWPPAAPVSEVLHPKLEAVCLLRPH